MCGPGGGILAGGGRSLSLLGWLLTFLSAASLGVAIANTVYTFMTYNNLVGLSTCSGSVITICRVIFTYISSGIWGSIPIFFTGLIAVRLTNSPTLMRMFKILVLVCTVVLAPAMIVLSSLEIVVWNGYDGANGYTITSSTINGNVVKFALPLVVAVLAAIEFIILLFLMCSVFRRGYMATGVATTAPALYTGGGIVGGYGGFGDDLVYGGDAIGGDANYGGDFLDPGFTDPGFDSGAMGPQFIPIGSGGGPGGAGGSAAGGAAAGGSASASSPSGGGSGGASNNNNNNIVVPPVIIPPAPAAAAPSFMPFPIYMPSNNSAPPAPIIINTTSNTPSNPPLPPPQPVFLPLPGRRRPPPRPLLRPLPPRRYYSGCGGGGYGLGGGFKYGGGGYMSSFDDAFQGRPWNRF